MQSIARRVARFVFAASTLILALAAHAEDSENPTARVPVAAPVAGSVAISQLDLSLRAPLNVSTLDLTSEPRDLWERMRQGFAMADLSSEAVTDHQIYYIGRPGALRTVLERGRKYLYFIVEELEKRGMPTELALLPLVESAYNPMAYSSAKASGLWQFIPSTGRDFNLAQNWWVDERRDVIASTGAALTYLQALYEMHGDWQLALASYNWGEASVMRAVNRNKAAGLPADFASLTMPAETRHYVPKLQALKNIIANPQLFGLTLPEIPNTPYFTTVTTRKGMDLVSAARMAEIPVKDFLELNPSFNRPVIPGEGGRNLVLPKDRAAVFLSNMENPDQPLLNWRTYSTRSGERIEQIAARFGISPGKLREVNGLPPRVRPAAGYTLLVPTTELLALSEAAPVMAPRASAKEPASRKVQTRTRTSHNVRSGPRQKATASPARTPLRTAHAKPSPAQRTSAASAKKRRR